MKINEIKNESIKMVYSVDLIQVFKEELNIPRKLQSSEYIGELDTEGILLKAKEIEVFNKEQIETSISKGYSENYVLQKLLRLGE